MFEKGHTWQEVGADENGRVLRMVVPGGYLYLIVESSHPPTQPARRHVVFVPAVQTGLPPGLETKG
jgi:hypothetical protein